MSKPKIVEIAALWKRPDGAYTSGPLMDDRVQDLAALMQDGPVKLFLKPVGEKRNPKAPDAHLLAIPIEREKGT